MLACGQRAPGLKRQIVNYIQAIFINAHHGNSYMLIIPLINMKRLLAYLDLYHCNSAGDKVKYLHNLLKKLHYQKSFNALLGPCIS